MPDAPAPGGSFAAPVPEWPAPEASPAFPAAPAFEGLPDTDTDVPSGALSFVVFQVYTFIVVCRPQDYFPPLVPLRLALVFSLLTAVLTIISRGAGPERPLRHAETRLYFILYAAMIIGIPFAINRRQSFNFAVLTYLPSMVFYVLFVLQVNTIERFRRVVFVLVVSNLVFSGLGLLKGHFEDGRFVTGSTMFDSNDVAFMNVCLIPFGLAAMLGSFSKVNKLLALTSVPLAVLLALYTGSRGGLLGMATMFLLLLAIRIPKVSRTHKTLVVLAVVITGVIVASKINMDRYLTLTDLDDDYNMSSEEGRLAIWKRGMEMFSDRPLTGIGVMGFWQGIGTMRAEEGLDKALWQAPHNSYVQALTEMGLLGAIPFFLLVGTSLKSFNDLRRRRKAYRDKDLDMLPGILLVGLISQLVAAFFLSQAYALSLTLFFALSSSLKTIAAANELDEAPNEADAAAPDPYALPAEALIR